MLLCFCCLCASAVAQQCSCIDNFRHMVAKVERNYAGFMDKVTASNRPEFIRYTDSLEQVAAKTGEEKCLFVLRKWIRFFRDRHMTLVLNGDSADNNIRIRRIFSASEKINVSHTAFMQYLEQNKQELDSLEGIWEDDRGIYRMAFMRDRKKKGQEFIGFILQADSVFWLPGQVKARIRKHNRTYRMLYFYNKNHNDLQPTLALDRHTFNAGIGGVWYKVYPREEDSMAHRKPRHYYDPSFSTLDSQTCMLALPSFSLAAKPLIDSLVEHHFEVIKKSRHFIIDLRNNTGGSVLCFQKLLPFLYTRPIITKGQSVMATEDNINDLYTITDYPNISDSMRNLFKKELAELRAHKGAMYNLWKDDTLVLAGMLPYPQKISFIINENCASAAEIILLKARQSSKVKIFGKHSMGAIDYLDIATTKMPCNLYSLRYATSRTNRLPKEPLDNKGIQPDVEIPDNVVDWVEFVRTKYPVK
ncbi:peptidase S41-like protein [Chitinophaga japonensis]|uniref:Peptidase S41-like protein n=2 Tax=Chitinophaga japonensis TaxID=104662 RepID=A0A562SIF2_CHIJA|nr:peptidase S41-like protein [Chitinophaga japonensis]